jgi:hypothetical protein
MFFCNPFASEVFAAEYYMATDGNNSNPGTIDAPWATLAYSLPLLSPGDTLYLRGGIYYQTNISVSISGTALAPITIQSYPGERAVLDGGYTYFRDAPNAEWELVDANINLYRSVRTFSNSDFQAWLLDYDVQLPEYGDDANGTKCIEATSYRYVNDNTGYYCGPGVQWRSDGRIYIRLEHIDPNTLVDEQGNPIAPVPPDTNPNNNRIAIHSKNTLLSMGGGPSYLRFKDLDLVYSTYTADCTNAHHIEFDGCYIKHGHYGIDLRTGCHDFEIHHCEFNNGVPQWLYWEDVKHYLKPAYSEFQSDSILGPMPNFNIHHNLFRDIFDGLNIQAGSAGASVTDNIFIRSHDDALNITPDMGGNVEIARNIMRHCFTGIGLLPSDNPTNGQIYIHHNVIDVSRLQHAGRPGGTDNRYWVWDTGGIFASHGGGDTFNLKFYNNTCIAKRNGRNQAMGPTQVTPNSQKYVYNNIFRAVNDVILLEDDLQSAGSHYNGDIFWQPAPGTQYMFESFAVSGNYYHLATLRAAGATWEANGLETDPGFDMNAIAAHNYEPNQIWELYRPTNPNVFTEGASYAGLTWPGTTGVDYRGAIPPDYGPDLNHNGGVDWGDLTIFIEHWLEQECFGPFQCEEADIDKSGDVDFADYCRIADYWLQAAP